MRAKEALSQFEAFLHGKGLRMTRPRRVILESAWKAKDHFSADHMFSLVRKLEVGASRATVYRTLSLLVECGFLSSMNDGTGTMLYESALDSEHHDHMICRRCGRIQEFHSEEIERLQLEYASRHGFTLLDHTLRLEGYCATCAD